MANTIDQNDPWVSWTAQKGGNPSGGTLTAGQTAVRDRLRSRQNAVLEDVLPDATVQAKYVDVDQSNRFLIVADTAQELTEFKSGSFATGKTATFYADWKAEADPA